MRRSAVLLALVTACAPATPVERVYEGRFVRGRFVEPEAYATFLRGAIAEASGDTAGAVAAYRAAASLEPRAAEIGTRLEAVRGMAGPRDRVDDAGVRPARLAGSGSDEATRERLVSLTLSARDPLLAWDALARWAESRADVALRVRALEAIVRIDPARRDALAVASRQLSGVGEHAAARALAAAAVDALEQPLSEELHPLAARLAVDEAIGRADPGTVRTRASRARIPLEEAAARALLAGKAGLARDLASPVARADPDALAAFLVVAVADGRDVLGAARGLRGDAPPVPGAVLVAFGAALVHAVSPGVAREALERVAHDRLVDGDDLVVRRAVELVVRGVLPATALAADGLVELAAMGTAGPLPARDDGSLDPRHAYLALALEHPGDPRARELGARLAPVAAVDPVVASAAALVALGSGAPVDRGAASALLAIDPSDLLLAATALRLAERTGDAQAALRARAAMAAHAEVF